MKTPIFKVWFHEEGETEADAVEAHGCYDSFYAAIEIVGERYHNNGEFHLLLNNKVKVSVTDGVKTRIVTVYGQPDILLDAYEE